MRHRFSGGYEPEPTPGWLYVVVAFLVIVGLILMGLWANWMYGDWRCAFAHCRLVK